MKTGPRRQQILNLLEETGSLDVGDLADRFAVSVVTIRKDLDDLERQGLLQRTFGGAVFSHRSRFNRSFLERASEHLREKRAIAAAALEYIKDGDTIILDAGTTTLALAQLLKQHVKSVFIITCSVPVALEVSSAGYDILLLGGMIRNKSLALLGRETLWMLDRYRADKAFLGSSGFTIEKGHTTPNPDDAQIKEAIMRVSLEKYVLVDSSKFGDQCLTRFAHLRDVDLTITDSHLPKAKVKALEAAGATIRIVDVGRTELKRDEKDPSLANGEESAVSPSRTLNLHRNRKR
ncbi:MAG TPA: DeoR/GlpR family DNA-binding transcription regulator [Chthoniobacterales bacterium]|nr:DeoR/GlpR family DNA-binding transcription regulator [Chthoniobacterales bacterium]